VVQTFQIPLRVDVKVAHLDKIRLGFSDELTQSLEFVLVVGETRQDKVIDGCKTSIGFHDLYALFQVLKGVPFRAKIGVIILRTTTVQADADAVQPGAAKIFHFTGKAAVGIKVNSPSTGGLTHEVDTLLKGSRLQKRLSFAPLPEAHHSLWGLHEVRSSHFGNFIRCGYERNALLRGT
jgi:hypothetical protein